MSIPNSLKYTIANCGFITTHIANKYFNIHENTFNTYVNTGELNKSNLMLFGKISNIYTLSNKNINLLRKECYPIYKHDSSQLEHDYLLLKTYLNLTQDERSTWQNETALKIRFGKYIETSDAIFIKNNKIVGVEVITPEYKKDKKDKKEEFLKSKCDDFIILNTKDFWRCFND